jgi:hypothetical protein
MNIFGIEPLERKKCTTAFYSIERRNGYAINCFREADISSCNKAKVKLNIPNQRASCFTSDKINNCDIESKQLEL